MTKLLSQLQTKVLATLIEAENQSLSSCEVFKKADIAASSWTTTGKELHDMNLISIQAKRDFDSNKWTWYKEVKLTKRGVLVALELLSIGQLIEN